MCEDGVSDCVVEMMDEVGCRISCKSIVVVVRTFKGWQQCNTLACVFCADKQAERVKDERRMHGLNYIVSNKDSRTNGT